MDGTVLVADDDLTIRTVLTQALTRAGCKVQATSSLTTLMRWVAEGRGDFNIPFRPDHGQDILSDLGKNSQPGYPAVGRLKGLAELRGIIEALSHPRSAA